MIALWWLACTGPLQDSAAPVEPVQVPLEPARLARRLSLDLRGVLPSETELDRAEAGELDALRNAWLADPRLEDRLVAVLGESWHTLVDAFEAEAFEFGLDPDQEHAFERAVGEEPLRLMARAITEGAAPATLVTAEWTVVDPLLLPLWPLEALEQGDGPVRARYTDGRPPVGVLATNGLWWRHTTTTENANRGRAAAIARLLTCEELTGPVSFRVGSSLLEEDGTSTAIREDPACQSCHDTLEPLAATLFGFWWFEANSVAELSRYHPERELLGPQELGVTPGWMGTELAGLVELGQVVARDPSFEPCLVQTLAQGFWRRPVDAGDDGTLAALGTELDQHQDLLALLAGVIQAPAYTAGGLTTAATDADRDRARTDRLLTPEQLASAVEELTGFRWSIVGFDMLRTDDPGVRVLAGGVDGRSVTRPQEDPGLTWALVVQRLAQAGAWQAVADGRLDAGLAPDDPGFTEQLQHWHRRTLGTAADDETVAGLTAMWQTVDDADGPDAAWRAVLEALLRDPAYVSL